MHQEDLLEEEPDQEEKQVDDQPTQSQDFFGVSSSAEEITPTPTLQITAPSSGTPCLP